MYNKELLLRATEREHNASKERFEFNWAIVISNHSQHRNCEIIYRNFMYPDDISNFTMFKPAEI